jgi:hypothetical protein
MRAATLLIVEDDPEIRQLVAELMRREGRPPEAHDSHLPCRYFAAKHPFVP